jgi:hypothetical protein
MTTYNLTVDHAHRYFVLAGGDFVLVRNSGGGVKNPTYMPSLATVRDSGESSEVVAIVRSMSDFSVTDTCISTEGDTPGLEW